MAGIDEWERRIGQRLRLKDLHVFFAVARAGSMAKAASHLGVAQPSVSAIIAGLEHALGAQLFDRTTKGVELTVAGGVLLRRGRVVFDELAQVINELEHLVDPTAGTLRVGCAESIAAGFLPPVVDLLYTRFPRVAVHIEQLNTPTLEFTELDERRVDILIARLASAEPEHELPPAYQAEILFDDKLCLVVGKSSQWAGRKRIELADLISEPWVMVPLETPGATWVLKALKAEGLELSRPPVTTYSAHLRNHLVSTGRYISVHPHSVVVRNAAAFQFEVLPIELPAPRWPVAAVTLKDRAINPIAKHFLACAREAVTMPPIR